MGFTVTLPLPPSANALFRNTTTAERDKGVHKFGRAKTNVYRRWRINAVKEIWAQVRADRRIGGLVSIKITFPRKNFDIDNRIKPVLDALVDSCRIDDDVMVDEIIAQRRGDDKPIIVVDVDVSVPFELIEAGLKGRVNKPLNVED